MSKRPLLTLSGVIEETPALLEPKRERVNALDLVASRQWAILPDALKTIVSVATRDNLDIGTIEEKLGRPLINTQSVSMRGNTAIIPISGYIFRYANMFTRISGGVSLDILTSDIRSAVENPQVKSIILEVDSPGGEATSIAELAQRIREMSDEKQIIAHIDGMGASGAYWLAASANEIVISSTGMVGSIGVVTTVYKDNDDSTVEIVSSQSPYKRVDVNTDEGRSKYQEIVDKYADVFINDVAKYRGVDRDTVLTKFGQGGMKLGQDAVDAGMADRVGTLESLITGLTGNNHSGGNIMSEKAAPDKPEITRAYLDANHPDIVKAIRQEGIDEGMKTGSESERDRIKSVQEQCLPGHEALIESLKFDGVTTGDQAAVKVLKAEKEGKKTALDDRKDDAKELNAIKPASEQDKQKKKDFNALVKEQIDAGKSRSDAIRYVAKNHPEEHQAFVDQQRGEQ